MKKKPEPVEYQEPIGIIISNGQRGEQPTVFSAYIWGPAPEPNSDPAPLSRRTDSSVGFQATRNPTGIGEGTVMGTSFGSSLVARFAGFASEGPASATARTKARERTRGRYQR